MFFEEMRAERNYLWTLLQFSELFLGLGCVRLKRTKAKNLISEYTYRVYSLRPLKLEFSIGNYVNITHIYMLYIIYPFYCFSYVQISVHFLTDGCVFE